MLSWQDLYAAPDAIEGAELWKLNWSHEQRTFSDYFRDGFAEGEDLVIASCADANDAMVQYCNGTFVTHLWGRKDEVRTVVCRDSRPRKWLHPLHRFSRA